MHSILRSSMQAAAAFLVGVTPALAQDTASPADEAALEHFEAKVRPILVQHCIECHSGDEPKGDLRLDSTKGIQAGVDGDPIYVAGDVEDSLIVEALRYDDLLVAMPPDGKLAADEIEAIERWVELGAHLPPTYEVSESDLLRWCFQPPAVGPTDLDTIDAFLDAALVAKGVEPSPIATRRAWLRRVTFDLTGLPPTLEELDAFLSDETPGADERVVDRLLASPAYGERWARRWLDLVRYAETKAHEFDYPILNAHRYRDYVIRAFEDDVPYDRFITEMIAGDLVESARLDPTGTFDVSILGTGVWQLEEGSHSPVEPRGEQADRVANKVEVLSKSVLALGVACARCHDHKFDPISAEDYHALAGFALSTAPRQVRYESDGVNHEVALALDGLLRDAQPAARAAVAAALEAEADGLAEVLLTVFARQTAVREHLPLATQTARERQWSLAAAEGVALGAAADWIGWCRAIEEGDPAPDARGVRSLAAYGSLTGARWITNGPAFGVAPRSEGDIVLDLADGRDGPEAVVASITARAAAVQHPTWSDLTLTESSTDRKTSLKWTQAGRTIVSPSFVLEHGRVAHLVRGSGHVLLSIASHKLIAGPLHAHSIQNFDTKGEWQWIIQDLPSGAGLEAHVELTASGDGVCEVAETIEIEADGVLPALRDQSWAVERFEDGEHGSRDAAAARAAFVEQRLRDAAALVRDGGIAGRSVTDDERATLHAVAEFVARKVPRVREDIAARLTDLGTDLTALEERRMLASRLAPAALDLDGRDEHVLDRGSWSAPGDAAPRRIPAILRANESPLVQDGEGSGRLAFARSLLASETAIVQRVWVNRTWHALFGRGIVETMDDFGAMGSLPTHPELLDRLTLDFARDGWSTRRLVRRIVLTDAYRRSTAPTDSARELDPLNSLLGHMRVRRLEAEEVRDALLAVSGELDRTQYGPSIPVHLTKFMTGRGRPGESGPLDGAGRRSIYIEVRRNFPHPLLTVFDQPIPSTCHGRRTSANVPAQALALWNDPFVEGQAEALAALLDREDAAAAIDTLWLRALARTPTAEERELAMAYVQQDDEDDLAPWVDLAHSLFNAKEFLFLE